MLFLCHYKSLTHDHIVFQKNEVQWIEGLSYRYISANSLLQLSFKVCKVRQETCGPVAFLGLDYINKAFIHLTHWLLQGKAVHCPTLAHANVQVSLHSSRPWCRCDC